ISRTDSLKKSELSLDKPPIVSYVPVLIIIKALPQGRTQRTGPGGEPPSPAKTHLAPETPPLGSSDPGWTTSADDSGQRSGHSNLGSTSFIDHCGSEARSALSY